MSAKEIKGWRDSGDDYVSNNPTVNALLDATRTHHGWVCPHCECRSDPVDAELNNEKYFHLLHESLCEPLEIRCGDCGKDYFLRAYMVVKYGTCVDKEFRNG